MQLTAYQEQFLHDWPALTLPPINLYNAPAIERSHLMQNWIQQITPLIKDSKGDLTTRQNKVIALLEEADRYWVKGNRNMAGEMFSSFSDFLYAAPFMGALKVEIEKRFSQDKYERLVNANPVRPSWQMSPEQKAHFLSLRDPSNKMKP